MYAVVLQIGLALAWYVGVIVLIRVAGKRLAGQITTFDLIILIGVSIVLQGPLLRDGSLNSFIFCLSVFSVHKLVTEVCFRSPMLRRLVRGKPRMLVKEGQVLSYALEREGLSMDELNAGLRKLGIERVEDVRQATLEETGHITATLRN